MIEMGLSKDVKQMMKFISTDKVQAIDEFYNNCFDRDYYEYKDEEVAMMNINVPTLSNDDSDVFLNYSGYNFKNINNALRGRWNYEENGLADKSYYLEIANKMRDVINNNQTSIGNLKLFRGVSLDYFKDYGISSLQDMMSLKGQFLLDKGFVSTSLVEDDCFYNCTEEEALFLFDKDLNNEYLKCKNHRIIRFDSEKKKKLDIYKDYNLFIEKKESIEKTKIIKFPK